MAAVQDLDESLLTQGILLLLVAEAEIENPTIPLEGRPVGE